MWWTASAAPRTSRRIADEAIEIGAKVLWMQLGVINDEAANAPATPAWRWSMDRCMKIEYARLFGGLNFVGVNTKVMSAKRPTVVPY